MGSHLARLPAPLPMGDVLGHHIRQPGWQALPVAAQVKSFILRPRWPSRGHRRCWWRGRIGWRQRQLEGWRGRRGQGWPWAFGHQTLHGGLIVGPDGSTELAEVIHPCPGDVHLGCRHLSVTKELLQAGDRHLSFGHAPSEGVAQLMRCHPHPSSSEPDGPRCHAH